MKYVILHPRNAGMTQILFTVAPMTHADLARPYAESHVAKTAGFCELSTGASEDRPAVRVFGGSDSLRLESHPDDARLIGAMVAATLQGQRPEVSSAAA